MIRGRAERVTWAFAVCVPVALLLVFFAWPVAAMLGRGLGESAMATYANPRVWRLVWTTLWMSVAGTVLSVACGLPGAYVLYVKRFPGRGILRGILTVPFVLPPVVVGAAFGSLLGTGGAFEFLNLDGTEAAVVAAMVFFNLSVTVRTVGALWASLDPRLTDAARTLGAGPVRVFWTVTLPALRPAIASAASLIFLFCSTAYGIVMTIGGVSTLESEIWAQTIRLKFDAASALSVIQCVIVAASLMVSARAGRATPQFLRRRRSSLVRSDLPALVWTVALACTVVVAPLVSLVARSLRRDGHWTIVYYRQLSTSGEGMSGGATVLEALWNSVRTASAAALIALAIGVPLALWLARVGRHGGKRQQAGDERSRRRGRATGRLADLVEACAMAPLGVSSVTVGFGYLIVLQAPPLMLGASAVPLAQAVVVVPMVIRSLLPVVRSIDPRLREAAETLGAGPWSVLLTVDLPLARRGLALAAGCAAAMALGEFGASSFLATGNTVTLPVLISRLINRPGGYNYGMGLAASVILGLLSAAIMAAAEYRRNDAALTS